MTNSQPHTKPTPPQLKYLKDLALAAGQSFTWPQTFGEASRAIKALEGAKRTSRTDRRRETRQVRRDMAERRGDGAAVRVDDELRGYGSSAGWQ
jgi:hypothetical protein